MCSPFLCSTILSATTPCVHTLPDAVTLQSLLCSMCYLVGQIGKSSLLPLLLGDADLRCACKHHCVGSGQMQSAIIGLSISSELQCKSNAMKLASIAEVPPVVNTVNVSSVRVLALISYVPPHTSVLPLCPSAPRRCWTLYLCFALCSRISSGRLPSSYLAPLLATQHR